MNVPKSRRGPWRIWFVALAFLLGVILFPESYRLSRLLEVALALIVWFGLIALVWRTRWQRFVLCGVTVLAVIFVAWPARGQRQPALLRQSYIKALQRYEGVTYHWGGEGICGIDCSGLVRRGMIDGLFRQGLRTGDGALVRQAADLWWHDCSASALGQDYRGLTTRVQSAGSLNVLDHSTIQPGDLAVTANGVHVMAYLGDRRWIEADPGHRRVITIVVPSQENAWAQVPVNIVRWTILQ